jgi:superfamily II DNA or RNA helicase
VATNRKAGDNQLDLFSLDLTENLRHRLEAESWPSGERFPLNRASETVRTHVWADLLASQWPLIIAGYASLDKLIEFAAAWEAEDHDGELRILLGTEPFESRRNSFGSPAKRFTEEAHGYWLERGISLRLSAKLVTVLDLLRSGRLSVRFVHGRDVLHAKVYVGDHAATAGSSNFTARGLSTQIEANARFDVADEPDRYRELANVGMNLWKLGEPWDDALASLLEQLLQVVTWQEALARAAADLLEGDWARDYLAGIGHGTVDLWPSQRAGIAQAMWIIENFGSVLVADATGSGKTRMGAHLVRAVRDRVWRTGRVRRDLTALVCPPAVEDTWRHEALTCGLTINTVSHGRLSRTSSAGPQLERKTVHGAQLLAVDEAHNFLNAGSNRTQFLRRNLADHVVLFTATPISRGAGDLLDLVALLGPDNFDDPTHEILRSLERGRLSGALDEDQARQLRREIQRFTLRRTKQQINGLVDEDPESYRHPTTGRICRYPLHVPDAYETGETDEDIRAADEIRGLAGSLAGIALLPRDLAVPKSMQRWFKDDQWLAFRLRSAAGLASHHVLSALRSSRAALYEHLQGTRAAIDAFELPAGFKSEPTGDRLSNVRRKATQGPPKTLPDCDIPEWLTDAHAWREACERELGIYERIGDQLHGISPARELRKAELLARLAEERQRVLAFDGHLITLAFMRQLLDSSGSEVIIATGQADSQRRRVQQLFAPESDDPNRVIALCSDAMNEGLNLQGASAVVHLDLPTTLRVAEQRVGRVDRMDSPHDEIEAWWPRDGRAFATRARERLVRRLDESRTLLGQNMPVPDLGGPQLLDQLDEDEELVDLEAVQREVDEALNHPPDELTDALEPVRSLVTGPDAIVSKAEYARQRGVTQRVLARVAPIVASTPWAFFAIRASARGTPRWLFIEPDRSPRYVSELPKVAASLRTHLEQQPANRRLDERAATWLGRCIEIASTAEIDLLPRRLQRALGQMQRVTSSWAAEARRAGDEAGGQRWRTLSQLTHPSAAEAAPDPAGVAEAWLELIADRMEQYREADPRRRYVLIDDVTKSLLDEPLHLEAVEAAVAEVDAVRPIADRIAACIIGVPEPA